MCCPQVLQAHVCTIKMEMNQKRPGYLWGSWICKRKKEKKAEASILSAVSNTIKWLKMLPVSTVRAWRQVRVPP